MPATSTRVPQQERSRATQARLLEATVECLVEHGWSGTTTTVVATRAGVSRGAQLHHYPTKAALVTAAVAHLTERRAAELRTETDALPAGPQRLDRVIDLLGAAFTGPLFVAALELWVAARTDAELRAALVPLEARVGREMHRLTVELLGVDERRPGVREAVQATLDLLRGLGVANLLSDDSSRRAALLHTWKRQLATLLTPDADPPNPGGASVPDPNALTGTPPPGGTMVDLTALLTDLAAESDQLDALVAALPPEGWARPTPAPGWTIAHQIAHLAWTDHVARLAATDADAFYASVLSAPDPARLVDDGAESFLAPPAELLARWRDGRAALATALAATPAGEKVPWYGTRMSPASMVTARIMETWAHGQDVADALGVDRTPTARLRHIAHLGFRTLGHGFAAHGRPAPTAPVRVELRAPDGDTWTFGPADATDRVTGPALDFCLLVTQRRHRADLALVATGPTADEWLDVAQAFAGPPGAGREPHERSGVTP